MTTTEHAAALRDPARVEAVRATGLLDAPSHPELVLLTRLAARAAHAPIAWVALLDDEREFFQTGRALPAAWASARQIPLAESLCRHAVAAGAPLVLDDVEAHADRAAVQATLHAGVRAYLGVPLRAPGMGVVGTVCVADRVPRRWTAADTVVVRDVAEAARWVVRRTVRDTRRQQTADGHRAVLGFVAHDLRNPLHVILTAVELARMEAAGEDVRAADPLRLIERAARRMGRLVQDLLDETAIETGRLSLERAPCRPGALLHAAAAEERALAAHARVTLEVQAARRLPAVCADRERVLQVLANLVGNALKFTPAGGHVFLGAADEGHCVRFWVRDDGPGIPAEARRHLFDPFWQARPDSRGVGLGLAIARGLVEAHGGRVWAEAGDGGRGTVFQFSLPTVLGMRG